MIHNKAFNIRVLKDNSYAMKLAWKLSRKKVVHALLYEIISYLEAVFISAYFLKYIIDLIEDKVDFALVLRYVSICGIVLMMVALYKSYVQNIIYPLTETKMYAGIYEKLYKKAENVELECFENAEFYNKYTMAIESAGDKVIEIINNEAGVISGCIAAIAVFYSLYEIDRFAVLFLIFPLIGNFVFGGGLNKMFMKRYRDSMVYSRIIKYVNRIFYLSEYANEIRLSNVYHLLKHKYKNAVADSMKVTDAYSRRLATLDALKNIFSFPLMFEGVLLYGSYRAIVLHDITFSEMAVFTSVVVTATSIMMDLSRNFMELLKNGMYVQNLKVFLEYEEKIPETYDGIMPEKEIISIEFKDVCFSYKEGEEIIKDLSFHINGGSKVALVGHNGAGKSTIIKLLLRLYDPDKGQILINGINIKKYNLKAYRKIFSAAFQDYRVFALSIKDNVLMGERYEDENKKVIDALKFAGVWDDIKRLDEGIETVLTKEFRKDGAVLSGGQYQKIVIARAFAKDASINIFDEPSSALDPIAECELYSSIMDNSINKTMLFISHRLSSALDANHVFMLEKGRIIEQGTHSELMKLNGAYADMYLKQARNYLAVND